MARSAKQVAALKKAQVTSAANRKLLAAVRAHPKGVTPKRGNLHGKPRSPLGKPLRKGFARYLGGA